MKNERKIIGSVWFSGMTTGKQQIGVVAAETATDEWKAYIGLSGAQRE